MPKNRSRLFLYEYRSASDVEQRPSFKFNIFEYFTFFIIYMKNVSMFQKQWFKS
jgi:hypothetical protein